MNRAVADSHPENPSGSWLVVGLGNPGERYARNRHNIGAMVVHELARREDARLRQHRARASAAQVRLGTGPGGVPGPPAVLAVPLTYMNESGGPVAGLCSFFRVDHARVVVVHDELDLDEGTVRLKLGGGEGGHNGLRSISRSIGTRDYLRVRVGIGRPPGRMDPADYVLRDVPASRRTEEELTVGEAADAVVHLVHDGLLAAQNHVHAR